MRLFTTAILGSLAICSPIYAADFRFVQIDVHDAVATQAFGVNARGHIVGIYRDANDITHSFLLRNSVFKTIEVPGAAATLAARGINARGDIVGNFRDSAGNLHGYLLSDGKFNKFDEGSDFSTFLSINNAGEIAGRGLNQPGAWIRRTNGNFVGVGHSEGINLTWSALSVQDNGRVVVGWFNRLSTGRAHGFISTRRGHFQVVDFPGQSVRCSGVSSINERGDMVGLFSGTDPSGVCDHPIDQHGFLLRNGEFTIIDFPGAVSTRAWALNNYGVIIGDFTDDSGNVHAFKAVPDK